MSLANGQVKGTLEIFMNLTKFLFGCVQLKILIFSWFHNGVKLS